MDVSSIPRRVAERLFASRLRLSDGGERNRVEVDPTARLRSVTVEIDGQDNLVSIGRGARLRGVHIVCEGNGLRLVIGESVKIRCDAELILRDEGSRIELGAKTSIESARIVSLEGRRIALGPDCMLSYGIEIRNSDSHSILDADTRERLNPAADVVLEEHVWVGAHVSILKGARVGADSIIGLGSLVAGEFPRGVILVGRPASVRRTGVTWTPQRVSSAKP